MRKRANQASSRAAPQWVPVDDGVDGTEEGGPGLVMKDDHNGGSRKKARIHLQQRETKDQVMGLMHDLTRSIRSRPS